MSDEHLYLEAMRSIETDERNEGLWAKAITLSAGDEDQAKFRYVELYVEKSKPVPEPEPNADDVAISKQELVQGFRALGYKLKKKIFGNGWGLIEPLGGRIEISTIDELKKKYLEIAHQESRAKEHTARPPDAQPISSTSRDSSAGGVLDFCSNYDKENFPEYFSGIMAHLVLLTTLCQDKLERLSESEMKKYLAFELGLIEWYNQSIMEIATDPAVKEEEKNARLFNFVLYYSQQKYGDHSEDVFRVFSAYMTKGLMYEQRRLGFDSFNDAVSEGGSPRPGFVGVHYLAEAIGFTWP